MRRYLVPRSLLVCPLLLGAACGDPALEPTAATAVGSARAALGSNLIYFGRLEVAAGQLKSADGTLPRPEEATTLRLFLPELGQFLCKDSCLALAPHLLLRFKGTEEFQEVPGIPQGDYLPRGPQAAWPRDTADVVVFPPSDADRIEAYMYWGRVSWNGATCRLAYDLMECPDFFAISDEYLSNFGRNFRIDVRP